MGKAFYVDYVNHCLRYYIKNISEVNFKNEVDRKNWIAVDEVLGKLQKKEKYIIIELFTKDDSLLNNVIKISEELNIEESYIWTVLSKITKKIARKREII